MKIDGNDEILKSGYTAKTPKDEQITDADFKNILKESVEKSTENPSKIQPTTLLDPISAIRFNPLSPQEKNITVERVENLLNLLENYHQQLKDPHVTLRTLQPILNTIAEEKDQLSAKLDTISNEDGLKDILNQTLVTASLEVIKFNRGDYITS
jgi:hypothetical protein